MKKLLIILIIFSSCNVLKNKKDIEQTKTTKIKSFQNADTLVFRPTKTIFKDTTIYVKNFEKKGSNTLKITYDKKGDEKEIVCIRDEIETLTETVETLIDNSKTKETGFNNVTIIYIFIGLGVLLVINKLIK